MESLFTALICPSFVNIALVVFYFCTFIRVGHGIHVLQDGQSVLGTN